MACQAARQGQPTEAVTFIDSALAGTRGQQSSRLVAELRIQQAYAYATLRDGSACTAAIAQARSHAEQGASDDDPPYLYWVCPAEITTHAGECLLQLGQPDQAVHLLDQGIAMFDALFDRDRSGQFDSLSF